MIAHDAAVSAMLKFRLLPVDTSDMQEHKLLAVILASIFLTISEHNRSLSDEFAFSQTDKF